MQESGAHQEAAQNAQQCSGGSAGELANVEVRVGNSPVTANSLPYLNNIPGCGVVIAAPAETPIDVKCGDGLTGQYVSIHRLGGSYAAPTWMSLCEVKVGRHNNHVQQACAH